MAWDPTPTPIRRSRRGIPHTPAPAAATPPRAAAPDASTASPRIERCPAHGAAHKRTPSVASKGNPGRPADISRQLRFAEQLSRQKRLEVVGTDDHAHFLDLPGDLLHGLELLQAQQNWLLR